MVKQSVSDRERFVASSFVEYLDWLNLIEFYGFQMSDFSALDDGQLSDVKLHKFFAQVTEKLALELELKKYLNDWKIWFQDLPHENVWIERTAQGISCGIVCGSGKMWRAQRLRDYIASDPNGFAQMLAQLRTSLDHRCDIVLRIHSYFRHSRFRTAWLGDIGGEQPYPAAFQKFVSLFTDRNRNAFERVSKTVIRQRFSEEIERNLRWGYIEVDGNGQFPKWEDIDEFLQYAYFHVDVHIPSDMLIGKPLDDLVPVLKGVLGAEREMMRAMNAV